MTPEYIHSEVTKYLEQMQKPINALASACNAIPHGPTATTEENNLYCLIKVISDNLQVSHQVSRDELAEWMISWSK